MPPKNLYLQTFGCQMNVYDSARIARLLAARDYRLVDDPGQADLIFVNTCSVREKPEQKVYSTLGRFRGLKNKKPGLIIGVGGCVAQQEGENLLKAVPYLDFVLGTKELRRIGEVLDGLAARGRQSAATALHGRLDPYASLPFPAPTAKVTAFVSIMQGCDNFCSFCIVPYVRGREVSRPAAEILEEVRFLAGEGVREVTLLGQNVNSYGAKENGGPAFVSLLEAVEATERIERVRFTTSHPKDLSARLVGAFGRLRKLCEHIHLPLQAGSNRVLRRMNRGYSREEYLEKIDRLRERVPRMSITSDVIVGFPGETDADFEDTLEMVERVQFDDLFSFCYSDRPETRASRFAEKVPLEVSRRRLLELQALQGRITLKKNRAWEGGEVDVLVEGPSKGNRGESMGRSRANHIVNFPGEFEAGTLLRVRIQRGLAHSLRGEKAGAEAGRRGGAVKRQRV